MKLVPHGEPYAGKLHVRFNEGAGVPDNKGRPALLLPFEGLGLPAVGNRADSRDFEAADTRGMVQWNSLHHFPFRT